MTRVVDLSNCTSFEDAAVMKFFEASTHSLLAQEAAAGVRHDALSVVGAERLSESGYFRSKIAREKLIKGSSILYSIVHATQFLEFLKQLADVSFDGKKGRFPDALPKASCV
jgi:uncharacterized protein YbjT (DUF2867 family)